MAKMWQVKDEGRTMDNAVDNAFGWCTKNQKKKKKNTNNKEEEYGSKNNGIILKGTTRIEKIKNNYERKKKLKEIKRNGKNIAREQKGTLVA